MKLAERRLRSGFFCPEEAEAGCRAVCREFLDQELDLGNLLRVGEEADAELAEVLSLLGPGLMEALPVGLSGEEPAA